MKKELKKEGTYHALNEKSEANEVFRQLAIQIFSYLF